MKFRYIGSGKESPRKITFMGTEEFTLGEVSEIHDLVCIEKLKGNKCFELVQDAVENVPRGTLDVDDPEFNEVEEIPSMVPVETSYAKPKRKYTRAASRT
jgi:hypothetical protein